jgi:hypothetical protein
MHAAAMHAAAMHDAAGAHDAAMHGCTPGRTTPRRTTRYTTRTLSTPAQQLRIAGEASAPRAENIRHQPAFGHVNGVWTTSAASAQQPPPLTARDATTCHKQLFRRQLGSLAILAARALPLSVFVCVQRQSGTKHHDDVAAVSQRKRSRATRYDEGPLTRRRRGCVARARASAAHSVHANAGVTAF